MDAQRLTLISLLNQTPNLLYNPVLSISNTYLPSPFNYSSCLPLLPQNANVLNLLSTQKTNQQALLSQNIPPYVNVVKQEEQADKFKIKSEETNSSRSNLYIKPNQENIQQTQIQRDRVKNLLLFIINNLGRVKDTDMLQEKIKYNDDPILFRLFEMLIERYSAAYKTKDEILKFITRKAFATIQDGFKKRGGSSECQTSETLCKRYFKSSIDDIKKLGININHRESFLQVLFPYRKNCKNKARYQELISKLATSSEFYEDYCLFLNNFKEAIEAERGKKIDLCVSFLVDCIQRNNLDEFVHYKRIPWLESWVQLTIITAQEMSAALKVRIKEERQSKKIKR